jgi:ssDNA-binding Zn-finger/Zn-ribbon topoisomerase 1/energy-coupling factor transporter ATP-binding protein EcfA2
MAENVEFFVNEFKKALQDEIDAIKEKKSNARFRARNGQLISSSGGLFYYKFHLDSEIFTPEDTPILIKFSDKEISGFVVSIQGFELVISVEENLGTTIPEALISTDPSYLLELLMLRLQEVLDGRIKFFYETLKPVFQPAFSDTEFQYIEDFTRPIVNKDDKKIEPNEAQLNAINLAISRKDTFIWGPPGTGKTTVLAWIAEALKKKDKRIIIASHTNVAVDQAIEGVGEILRGTEDFENGKIVRFGNINPKNFKKENIQDIFKKVTVENILKEKENELSDEKEKLQIERGNLKKTYEQLYKSKSNQIELSLRGVQSKIDKLETQLGSKRKQRISVLIEEKSKLLEKRKEIDEHYNRVRKIIKNLLQIESYEKKTLELTKSKNQLEIKTDEISAKLRNLEEQLRNIDAKLSQLINSSPIARLYKKVFSGIDQQKLVSEKTGLFVQKTKLTEEKINIVNNISNIESEISALEESKKDLALETELDTQDLTKSKKEDFEQQEKIITSQIAEIDDSIKKIDNLISNLPYDQEEMSLINKIDYLKQEESVLYEDLNDIKSLPELKELMIEIEEIDRKIAEIETKLQNLKELIIYDAKIIATTLSKTFTSEEIYRKPFDVVIIDEASMAPLPMLFFTSGLSKDKIIILGDFRQLAPIAIAETTNVERWLRRDIYELTGIIESGGKLIEKKESHRLTILIEQHRMHPNISYLSSELLRLYEGGLKNAEDTKTIMPDVAPAEGKAVCLVDTSDYNPWCNKTPDYSRLNIYDALVIKSLIKNHILKSDKIKADEIAVITPFKAQAKLISTILKESDNELQDILVASIHRFQGKERKVMIFDSTISYPEKSPPKLLKYTSKEDIDNTNRIINVAITRARNKLLIIGNSTYIQERLDKAHPLYKIISHIQNEKGRGLESIYSKAILPECFSEDLLAMEERLFEPFFEKTEGVIKEFYTERDFFPQFRQDILKATTKVVISSPFITRNRLDYFINSFRQLITKDVDIYIFTKPVKELPLSLKQLADEVSRLLTREKCKIIYKPLLHNKVAVIDDKIFWMGSLNILSHRNTAETMVRFATPDTVTFLIKQGQINKFINTEKIVEKQKAFISFLKRELDKVYCDECGEVMNVKISRYGPFFVCVNNHIKNISSKILEELLFPEICPICGSPLVIKYARGRGRFWGCSKYPECRFTKEIWDIDISE